MSTSTEVSVLDHVRTPRAAASRRGSRRHRAGPWPADIDVSGCAFGATGAILVGQCIDGSARRGGRYGVAAVSGAAGLGVAVIVERVPP